MYCTWIRPLQLGKFEDLISVLFCRCVYVFSQTTTKKKEKLRLLEALWRALMLLNFTLANLVVLFLLLVIILCLMAVILCEFTSIRNNVS